MSIRGALQLAGDKCTRESTRYAAEYTNENQVQSISVREDGTAELSHHFPLILPFLKIVFKVLKDVYVSIDLFDYELPGTNQLANG